MSTPLQSVIASGTKVWSDGIDPEDIARGRSWGITGATSNPIIIADLIETGHFDKDISRFLSKGLSDEDLAWAMTDLLVGRAQEVFLPVWEATKGDDGWVSFELDPLLEDPQCPLSQPERTARYVALGKQWSAGRKNRMIKVPATPAGLAALEELAAAGVTLNVTLIFSEDQYRTARDAIWRGAQRRKSLDGFKSVYSIFVSRLDVYTAKQVKTLSHEAQGQVGIVNAKRIWKLNQQFWADKGVPLKQEMIFASTGPKLGEPAWKYVEAFAGSDIETNPPATNEAVRLSGRTFTRMVDQLPPPDVLAEIDKKVDMKKLEETLMDEGLAKFADPQKALLKLIADKRAQLKK